MNYINGTFLESSKKIDIKNKYDGKSLGPAYFASVEQVELATSTAAIQFIEEKKLHAHDRILRLKKIIEEYEKRKKEFAQIISAEAGKPMGYANAEAERALDTLIISYEEAKRIGGEVVPMDWSHAKGKSGMVQRFPIGPVIAISPFNFPLNLAMHKIAPALACGCPIVIKPSPYAPLSLLKFAEVLKAAGVSGGMVQILLCDNSEAEVMVKDSRFKLLSFTGSPAIGWKLKNLAGKKKVLLELGGNASVIVDEGVDLKTCAAQVASGAFLYSGQICISTQRVIVLDSQYDNFKKELISAVKNIKVGDPSDQLTVVGPLIDRVHLERIDQWVQEAKQQGAHIVYGGEIIDKEKNLYAPTVIENAPKNCKVCAEEVFGPVMVLIRAKSFKEALEISNDSQFGLQSGVFTNDLTHMKRAHRELEVGAVIINGVPGFRIDHMPYGGVKDSGLGREGPRYVIEEMTESRLLVY